MSIDPKDLKVTIFPRCYPEWYNENGIFIVKIEHIPSQITVTNHSPSQKQAKELCIKEIEVLLEIYETRSKPPHV